MPDARLPFRPAAAVFAVAVAALAAPVVARAEPPVNDNRAAAAAIPAFPATIAGTTVEATVERLDPQVSDCGRIEGTVWYRIDQAPDGTIALDLQGPGFAPVVRVYTVVKSALKELDCSSAKAGATAGVSFGTTRGATYFVLVGRRPGTADGAFELAASLFLPPANDSARGAAGLGKLPATTKGTTIGATSAAGDPESCSVAGGTVWYSVKPSGAQRLIARLHADGDLDAALVVLQKVRSQIDELGCARTNAKGDLTVAWDVDRAATYLLAVGQRKGSRPGGFTLRVDPAQAREQAPGARLRAASVRSTVNWIADVNDVYWRTFEPGTTYRIAFASDGCPRLDVRSRTAVVRSLSCTGYTTFTPGPDGGGRYVFEVTARANAPTSTYRLTVAAASPDDVGVGVELPNLATRRGTLAPGSGDVVDLYHFDVATTSEVRLRLTTPRRFTLALLSDEGGRIGAGTNELSRRLQRGRYVVAVQAPPAEPAGSYTLALVVRNVTSTSLTASASEVQPGASVTFTITTAPAPDGGSTDVQIDRFDPLEGWQFYRMIRVAASTRSITWTPPALGRWRARASYRGNLAFSPSRSDYVRLLVATPLPPV